MMNETIEKLVMTRGATLKRNNHKDFIAISYTARKKKHQSSEVNPNAAKQFGNNLRATCLSSDSGEIVPKDDKKEQDIRMKRARYDIIKFGSSGFVGTKKEEAKIALAVRLGAKPAKKKGKNYKELRLERQKAKEQTQKQELMSEIGKNVTKHRTDKKCRKQPHLLSKYGIVKNVNNYKSKER